MAFKFQIEEATRTKAKLRMALSGPGGAGKTKSALLFPARFQKQTVTLDLDAVRKALEAGETIEVEIDGKTLPGAVLGARGKGVRIR